jgi:hypothetical protein
MSLRACYVFAANKLFLIGGIFFLSSKASYFYPYFFLWQYCILFYAAKKERVQGWTIEMLLKQGEFTSRSKNFF